MKYQVSFSLKNNEKVFMNVVCCSRGLKIQGTGMTPYIIQHLHLLHCTEKPEKKKNCFYGVI